MVNGSTTSTSYISSISFSARESRCFLFQSGWFLYVFHHDFSTFSQSTIQVGRTYCVYTFFRCLIGGAYHVVNIIAIEENHVTSCIFHVIPSQCVSVHIHLRSFCSDGFFRGQPTITSSQYVFYGKQICLFIGENRRILIGAGWGILASREVYQVAILIYGFIFIEVGG